jgi:RNA polymerase primary sigma factor
MAEIVSRWKATGLELADRLGRQPTSAEIAEELDLPQNNWDVVRETVLANSQPTYSMNEDASSVFSEQLEDPRSRSPEEEIFSTLEVTRLSELLEAIDEKQARILRLRYGLETGEQMTLKAIGEEIGMPRERVRQLEQEALQKLYAILAREFGEEDETSGPKPAARVRRKSSVD